MNQPGLFDQPEQRAQEKLLRDPAMAAAIAKCLIARMEPASKIALQAHPQQCRWCKYVFARLADALNEFNIWAGWDGLNRPQGNTDPDWPALEPQVEAFLHLPYEEQLKQTARAAGYPEDIFDTGYGYPPVDAEGTGNAREDKRKTSDNAEPVTDDQKSAGPGASPAQPESVGGRDGVGDRVRRGVGGPETAAGAGGRGLPDRGPAAPGPQENGSSVPTDPRYTNDDDGSDQPF